MFSRSLPTVLIILLLLAPSAQGQNERQFSFSGRNGAGPDGGLVVDADGNFYGVTGAGGSADRGTVYELSPKGGAATETVLYSFIGDGTNGDGAIPVGELLLDGGGNLYGVTEEGGAFNQGTVFELSPPQQAGGAWTESIVYSFQGSPSDGAMPRAGLILDAAGNLYGTTSQGGDSVACVPLCGVVFELSPPAEQGGAWSETILHAFQGVPDGYEPLGGVIFDPAGNLYGTTYSGGEHYAGTVFELSPPPLQGGAWTETQLFDFWNTTNGLGPKAGLAISSNGTLFGTASGGGQYGQGTLFGLFPPSNQGDQWGFRLLYNFPIGPGSPLAPLTIGGPRTIYGTTGGSVFELTFSDGTVTYTGLYGFASGDVESRLILHGPSLYGTASGGGSSKNCVGGCGVVFQVGR